MKNHLTSFLRGVHEVVFPSSCLACGIERTLSHQYLCPFCLSNGFERANPEGLTNASGEILPEGVVFQDALWTYHKGSALQQLMYHLKYDYKASLGRELGVLAAHAFAGHSFAASWIRYPRSACIVPVPLHPVKRRVRGFNQARKIAEGVARVLNIEIIPSGMVRRSKSTTTQTDFSLLQRMRNMQSAFDVRSEMVPSGKRHLIVDDVFTTGTTVFELARQLRASGSEEIGILTVAQA